MSSGQRALNSDQGRPLSSYERADVTRSEMALRLWRSKWLMLGVFLPILGMGLSVSLTLPQTYDANIRIHVATSSFDHDNAMLPAPNRLAHEAWRADVEILQSATVAKLTLERTTIAAVYPNLSVACENALSDATTSDQRDHIRRICLQAAVAALQEQLVVRGLPGTSIIKGQFSHTDAQMSARVLNTLADVYIAQRKLLMSPSGNETIRKQFRQYEALLAAQEGKIRAFLDTHNMAEFQAERALVREQYQSVRSEMIVNRSRLSALEAALAAQEQALAATGALQAQPAVEPMRLRLQNLQLEREDKLLRYKPDSRVIRDLDRRIRHAEAYLSARQDESSAIVNQKPAPVLRGVNLPESPREAESIALKQQRAELMRESRALEQRQLALAMLEPEYDALVRHRDTLRQMVQQLAEQQILADSRLNVMQERSDSVTVLESAVPPLTAHSWRLPVSILVVMFAGLMALLVGRLKARSYRDLTTAESVERYSGLPVLSAVPRL